MPIKVENSVPETSPNPKVVDQKRYDKFRNVLAAIIASPVEDEINKQIEEWLKKKDGGKNIVRKQIKVEIKCLTYEQAKATKSKNKATGETTNSTAITETQSGSDSITIVVYCEETLSTCPNMYEMIIHELVHAKLDAVKKHNVAPPVSHHKDGDWGPYDPDFPDPDREWPWEIEEGTLKKRKAKEPADGGKPQSPFYDEVDKFYNVLVDDVGKKKKAEEAKETEKPKQQEQPRQRKKR